MIREKVEEVVKDLLETDEVDFTKDLREDYEIDSIGLLDTIMTLEDEFDIEFSTEELESLKTLNDVVKMIEEKTK